MKPRVPLGAPGYTFPTLPKLKKPSSPVNATAFVHFGSKKNKNPSTDNISKLNNKVIKEKPRPTKIDIGPINRPTKIHVEPINKFPNITTKHIRTKPTETPKKSTVTHRYYTDIEDIRNKPTTGPTTRYSKITTTKKPKTFSPRPTHRYTTGKKTRYTTSRPASSSTISVLEPLFQTTKPKLQIEYIESKKPDTNLNSKFKNHQMGEEKISENSFNNIKQYPVVSQVGTTRSSLNVIKLTTMSPNKLKINLMAPSIYDSDTGLPYAENFGFDPKSVVYESDFKPVVDNGEPMKPMKPIIKMDVSSSSKYHNIRRPIRPNNLQGNQFRPITQSPVRFFHRHIALPDTETEKESENFIEIDDEINKNAVEIKRNKDSSKFVAPSVIRENQHLNRDDLDYLIIGEDHYSYDQMSYYGKDKNTKENKFTDLENTEYNYDDGDEQYITTDGMIEYIDSKNEVNDYDDFDRKYISRSDFENNNYKQSTEEPRPLNNQSLNPFKSLTSILHNVFEKTKENVPEPNKRFKKYDKTINTRQVVSDIQLPVDHIVPMPQQVSVNEMRPMVILSSANRRPTKMSKTVSTSMYTSNARPYPPNMQADFVKEELDFESPFHGPQPDLSHLYRPPREYKNSDTLFQSRQGIVEDEEYEPEPSNMIIHEPLSVRVPENTIVNFYEPNARDFISNTDFENRMNGESRAIENTPPNSTKIHLTILKDVWSTLVHDDSNKRSKRSTSAASTMRTFGIGLSAVLGYILMAMTLFDAFVIAMLL